MKINSAEKYFKQKKWSILEIVCVVMMVVSFAVAYYLWSIEVIGFTAFAVFGLVFICSRSMKVKDTDIDAVIAELTVKNKIDMQGENIICSYDLQENPIKKGNDEIYRSRYYVISSYGFTSEYMEITVHRMDLITKDVKTEVYQIIGETKITLEEKMIRTPSGSKKAEYLVCDAFEAEIPVSTNEIHASKLVDRIVGIK